MLQFQICYHSQFNVLQKTKTNINFKGQAWVKPLAKCWVKDFILANECHAPNFEPKFWNILAN